MIENIWKVGMQASVLILIILVVRMCLIRYSKLYSYLLWIFVLVRLLCPVFIESSWSVQPNWAWQEGYVAGDKESARQSKTAGLAEGERSLDGNEESALHFMDMRTAFPMLKGILKYIWAAGVLCAAVCFLLQYIRMKRLVATAVREGDGIWRCEKIASPFVMGLFVPRIYMPYDISERAFDIALRHERTHIRHMDPVVRIAGMLSVCLHWWNPFIWYGIRKMNQDMEMFCDESVLAASPMGDRKAYADILLHAAIAQSGYSAVLPFGESNTEKRITNILNRKRESWAIPVLASVAVFVLAAILFITPKKALAEADSVQAAAEIDISKETAQSKKMHDICGIYQGEAEIFWEELRDALENDERERAAKLIAYPKVMETGAESIYLENEKDFLEYYDMIFTESFKKFLSRSLYGDMQYNDSGIFLGNGEIWIAKSEDAICIAAISNAAGVWVHVPNRSKSYYQQELVK